MDHDQSRYIDYILIAVLVILGAAVLYFLVVAYGPPWDLTARYLNGRTLFDMFTHNITPQAAFAGEFMNNLLFYFEPYREPLSMLVFAAMDIFSGNSVVPYLIAVYAGFLFAFYKLSREIKIDMLIAFSAFVNSYVLYFLFFVNGGEALCIIFVLFGLVYLFRKSPLSGLMLGLAVIAKYPAMALLPVVLLIGDRKKTAIAIALELIPIALWGVFDYVVYGVPFYSYIESIGSSNVLGGLSTIYPVSVLMVIAYPLAFALAAFAILRMKKQRIRIRMSHTVKVLASVIALSAITYALVLPHNDPVTQARYGFLLSIALLVPAAMLLTKAAKKAVWIRYGSVFISIAVLALCIFLIYSQAFSPNVSYYNTLQQDSIYQQAGSALSALGFNGCRFISNAWVPMIYYGYDSYSPFILYTNGTLTPFFERLSVSEGLNYTRYLTEQNEYPIIVFKYIGVTNSYVLKLNQTALAYSGPGFDVYLPKNASCYVGVNMKRS